MLSPVRLSLCHSGGGESVKHGLIWDYAIFTLQTYSIAHPSIVLPHMFRLEILTDSS